MTDEKRKTDQKDEDKITKLFFKIYLVNLKKDKRLANAFGQPLVFAAVSG